MGEVAAMEGQCGRSGPACASSRYARGNKEIKEQVDGALKALDVPITALFSTLGRTAARGLEAQWAAGKMRYFYDQLIANIKAGDLNTANVEKWKPSLVADRVQGCRAERGAARLARHWVKIKGTKIDSYQCVVPTHGVAPDPATARTRSARTKPL